MFNSERFRIARERRGLTKKALADLAGLTSKTISTYENWGMFEEIGSDSIQKIANALNYPVEFFSAGDIKNLSVGGVSFRAMTKLSAAKRDAALSAGILAMELSEWIENQFTLPSVNVPEIQFDSFSEPETAAVAVRAHWGLGELSISNMVHLLESKGVRVFSLAENCKEVDAFSFWQDEKPYVLLNTMKSPERSRFDAAHELGHLVLHKHSSNNDRQAEMDADRFASAFLMPKRSILAKISRMPSLAQLLILKKNWKVSLSALVRRTYDLGLSSDWHYRQLSIDLATRGFRTSEPEGMSERETSLVLEKIFAAIRAKGTKRIDLLNELNMPLDELSTLTFNNSYFELNVIEGSAQPNRSLKEKPKLFMVK